MLNHQNELKNKRNVIKEILYYFRLYHSLGESINGFDNNIIPDVFMNVMDKIDDCIDYLNNHVTKFHLINTFYNYYLLE